MFLNWLHVSDASDSFTGTPRKMVSKLKFDHDPLLKLKQREVDLKAMDAERKMKEDEARINLDRAKMVQAKDLTEQKLEQNEDLAKLRADTSIEKSLMSMGSKLATDAAKTKDCRIVTGKHFSSI